MMLYAQYFNVAITVVVLNSVLVMRMKKFSLNGQIYIALFASVVSHFLDALGNLAKIGRILVERRSSVRMLGHLLYERLWIDRKNISPT